MASKRLTWASLSCPDAGKRPFWWQSPHKGIVLTTYQLFAAILVGGSRPGRTAA
jgi:hypothetical protein